MGKGGISDDSSDVVVPLATILERSRYLHLMHFLKNVHQHACNIFPFWNTYSRTSNTYTMIDQKNICEYLFVERSGRIVFQKIYSIHVRKFIYVFKQGSFQQMSMKKISILEVYIADEVTANMIDSSIMNEENQIHAQRVLHESIENSKI